MIERFLCCMFVASVRLTNQFSQEKRKKHVRMGQSQVVKSFKLMACKRANLRSLIYSCLDCSWGYGWFGILIHTLKLYQNLSNTQELNFEGGSSCVGRARSGKPIFVYVATFAPNVKSRELARWIPHHHQRFSWMCPSLCQRVLDWIAKACKNHVNVCIIYGPAWSFYAYYCMYTIAFMRSVWFAE